MCHISINLKERTVRPGSKVQGTLNIDFPTGLKAVKQIKLELIGVSGVKSGGRHRGTLPVTSSYTSYDENVVLKKLGANTAPFDRSTRLYYDARTIYPPATLLDNAQEFEEARTNYPVGSSINENFKFILSVYPLEVPIPPEHPEPSPLLGPPSKHAGSLPGPKKEPGKALRMPLPPTFMAEPHSWTRNYAVVQYYLYVTVKSGSGDFEKKFPLKMLEVQRVENGPNDEYKWSIHEPENMSDSWEYMRDSLSSFVFRPKAPRAVIITHMPSGTSLKPGQTVTPKVYVFVDKMPISRSFSLGYSCVKFIECTTFLVDEDPEETAPYARTWERLIVAPTEVCSLHPIKDLASNPALRLSTKDIQALKGLCFYADLSESFPTFTVPVPKGPSVVDGSVHHSYSVHMGVSLGYSGLSVREEFFKAMVLGPVDSEGHEDPQACARLLETPKMWCVLGIDTWVEAPDDDDDPPHYSRDKAD